MMIFRLPQLPTLSTDEAVARTSTGAGTEDFKDVFSDLALGHCRNRYRGDLLKNNLHEKNRFPTSCSLMRKV
jgi:hypothetical protein